MGLLFRFEPVNKTILRHLEAILVLFQTKSENVRLNDIRKRYQLLHSVSQSPFGSEESSSPGMSLVLSTNIICIFF